MPSGEFSPFVAGFEAPSQRQFVAPSARQSPQRVGRIAWSVRWGNEPQKMSIMRWPATTPVPATGMSPGVGRRPGAYAVLASARGIMRHAWVLLVALRLMPPPAPVINCFIYPVCFRAIDRR